jgi:Winged helix DNA-binding domain
VIRAWLRAQGLAGPAAGSVAEAVRRAGALQAQAPVAMRLGVRARSRGLVAADVDTAIGRREVVVTWAFRGTLHLLPAEDVRWVVALLGARYARGMAGRRRQLGWDDAMLAAAREGVVAALAPGEPLTRAALLARLADAGVTVPRHRQAAAHLLSWCAMTGLVCRGPLAAGDEATYVLLDDWVPPDPGPRGDDALAELARRHLAAYAPAQPEDLAVWSGLPLSAARRAHELAGIGPPSRGPAQAPERPHVRLLPAFDGYLLGHKERSLVLPPEHAHRIQAGGGIIHPTVLVDGVVAGRWDQRRLTVQPFGPLPEAPLEAELADVRRFLGA